MSDTTPITGLQELDPNQSQPHLTLNFSLRRLDALVRMSAISFLDTPPSSPSEGDSYLVTAGTGLWVGQDNNFTYAVNGAWQFVPPRVGWKCYVESEGADYQFSPGSPTGWEVYSTGSSGGGGGGGDVGATTLAELTDVDLTNLHDGYALVWNATSHKYEFVSIAAGGTISLADLSDVQLGSPAAVNGDVMTFDSSTDKWIAHASRARSLICSIGSEPTAFWVRAAGFYRHCEILRPRSQA
jgi:hypothetical protein